MVLCGVTFSNSRLPGVHGATSRECQPAKAEPLLYYLLTFGLSSEIWTSRGALFCQGGFGCHCDCVSQ